MAVDRSSIRPVLPPEAQELLDTLSTAVIVLDEALTILSANSSAENLLGVSSNQARGRPLLELLSIPEVLQETFKRVLENATACAQREVSLRPIALGGEDRVMDVCAAPLETSRSQLPPDQQSARSSAKKLVIEISDATQRQRLSRETALLAQLGGSRLMIRQLAHEIKNPLGGLRGAAQLLERQLKDDAMREYTEIIISEADRLAALVDSMLGPGRLPRKERLNVHELCEHVHHLLRSEALGEVLIERDYDPSVPPATLDRHMIVQAMLNLGRNALQAVGKSAGLNTDNRGRIILRTRVLSNQSIGTAHHRLVACVQFEDNGSGVPPQIREMLFYPFVTAREGGTGLGLAVAQDLVTRHGGLIEFESEPGRTLFSLLLPIED
jgi:two-component system nitrogen regulation sensor histidine kinase GlnL